MADIFLLPGEFYFGNEYQSVKTLLGSCVAITMWNKRLKIGGMCHYKLPRRLTPSSGPLDGSYGEEAMLLFMENLNSYWLKPADMVVGVFGAGDMFQKVIKDRSKTVGVQNIKLAHQVLDKLGFEITHESLGGNVSRKISLDLTKGVIKVQGLDVRQQKWL